MKTKGITSPVITETELTKAHFNLLNKEQAQMILQRTPKDHVYTRPAKGGGTWNYVTGTYVKKVLNMVFGWDWDFIIVEHKFDLNVKQAYVLGQLAVRVSDGEGRFREIKKMQFGRVDIKFKTEWVEVDGKRVKQTTDEPLDIGNDLKAAATDALKKCASELGVASDIYGANEFREITVIGESMQEKRDVIERMLDTEGMRLTEDDRMNVERILDQEEEESYDRTIKFLNQRLPKAAKTQ